MPFIVPKINLPTYEDFIRTLPTRSPDEGTNVYGVPQIQLGNVLNPRALPTGLILIENKIRAETAAIRQAVEREAARVAAIDFSKIKLPEYKLPQSVIDKIKENLVINVLPPTPTVRPPVVTVRPPVRIQPAHCC